MNQKLKTIWLAFEFVLLFFGVPLYIYFDPKLIYPSVLVLPILVGIFIYLKRLPNFRFKDLIKLKIPKKEFTLHLLVAVVTAVIMLIIIYLFDHDNLFNLLKAKPLLLLMLCTFYPVFSAYGQEIIYRTFLFYRYRKLFKTDVLIVLASSVAFSFVHIVYYSHVSILLTLILGLYLAKIYLKTQSVLFAAILHGIYGDLVFIVGLGHYFWLDMFEWMQ